MMMKRYRDLGYRTKMVLIIILSVSILSVLLLFSYSQISKVTVKIDNLNLLNKDLRRYVTLAAEVEDIKRMVLRFSYTGSPFEIETVESKYNHIVNKLSNHNNFF